VGKVQFYQGFVRVHVDQFDASLGAKRVDTNFSGDVDEMHLRPPIRLGGKGSIASAGRSMIVDSIRLGRPFAWLLWHGFDCGAMGGKLVLGPLARGVLGDVAGRTASFGYISVMRRPSAGEIRREGGSRPNAITLVSMPVVGSGRRSASPPKAQSCEFSRSA